MPYINQYEWLVPLIIVGTAIAAALVLLVWYEISTSKAAKRKAKAEETIEALRLALKARRERIYADPDNPNYFNKIEEIHRDFDDAS